MSRISKFFPHLPCSWRVVVAAAWMALGCGGEPTPAPGFTPVTSAADGGVLPDAASEAPTSPPAKGAPSDAATDPKTSEEAATPPRPVVWTAPADEEIPCENRQLSFDFDPSQRKFSRNEAFWMMWLAMRTFRSDDPDTRKELASVGWDEYEHIDDGASGVEALVAGSEAVVVVGFRGSTDIEDYINNAKFLQMDGEALGVAGKLHSGFGGAVEKNWEDLYDLIASVANQGQPIWLTGHSLGGTMATVTAVKLAKLGYDVAAVYSFAGPRAGNSVFSEDALVHLGGRSYRIVNHLDLTPRIPPAGVAADEASDVLGFNPLEGWAADVVEDLDYAHASTMYRFGPGTELGLIGTNGDWEDKEYWSERAASVGNLVALVKDDRDHPDRHLHTAYLCKMQAVRQAAGSR